MARRDEVLRLGARPEAVHACMYSEGDSCVWSQ